MAKGLVNSKEARLQMLLGDLTGLCRCGRRWMIVILETTAHTNGMFASPRTPTIGAILTLSAHRDKG